MDKEQARQNLTGAPKLHLSAYHMRRPLKQRRKRIKLVDRFRAEVESGKTNDCRLIMINAMPTIMSTSKIILGGIYKKYLKNKLNIGVVLNKAMSTADNLLTKLVNLCNITTELMNICSPLDYRKVSGGVIFLYGGQYDSGA